jgi:hypothetical protein
MNHNHLPPHFDRESSLEARLQEFIRTDEFKSWFGDWEHTPEKASKLVDGNGVPLIVYSGLPAGIARLSGNQRVHTGDDEIGFYFTKRYSNAKGMAEQRRDPITDAAIPSSVYAAFLNIRSPYYITKGDKTISTRVTEKPNNVDGLINDKLQEIVVFDPDQILFIQETRIY